jgi:uncharacterized protein YneF (UPF0154 family)
MTDQQSSGSSVWKWILGAIALLLVAIVGGGWFAWKKVAGAMQENVQAIAVINEQIGTIRSMQMNAEATAGAGRPGVVVFDLVGSKAEGRLTIEVDTSAASGKFVKGGTLVLKDGASFTLSPDGAAPAAPEAPATTPAPTTPPAAGAAATPAPSPPAAKAP